MNRNTIDDNCSNNSNSSDDSNDSKSCNSFDNLTPVMVTASTSENRDQEVKTETGTEKETGKETEKETEKEKGTEKETEKGNISEKFLDEFEAHIRKLDILKGEGPLCPEILPYSKLSDLEDILVQNWKDLCDPKNPKKSVVLKITHYHGYMLNNPNDSKSSVRKTGRLIDLSIIDAFNTFKNQAKNIDSILWCLTMGFPMYGVYFNYVGSGCLPNDFYDAARSMSYHAAVDPAAWEDGSVYEEDTLEYEKTNHIYRYCSENMTSSSSNTASSSSGSSSSSSSSSNPTTPSSSSISSSVSPMKDYDRKLIYILKHRVCVPEVMPSSNLSKLEKWILKKKTEEDYPDEEDYTLSLLLTQPLMTVRGGRKLNVSPYVLCFRVGEFILMSILGSLNEASFEAAVYDIMMNPLVMGTPESNTKDKSIYILPIDNTRDTPDMVNHEHYLVFNKELDRVIEYGPYDSVSRKIGNTNISSYSRIIYEIDSPGENDKKLKLEKELEEDLEKKLKKNLEKELEKSKKKDKKKEEVIVRSAMDLKLYDPRTPDLSSHKKEQKSMKVLFVPVKKNGIADFSNSYTTYIGYSHERFKNYWYWTSSTLLSPPSPGATPNNTQEFLYSNGLFIDENNQSYIVYHMF